MWKDFKAFLARGSVIDLAVGIIIGGAFGKVVSTLVDNVLMPPLGVVLARVDFSHLYINLSSQRYPSFEAAQAAGAPTIAYGLFITTVVDFLFVSLAIFLAVRWIHRLQRPQRPAAKLCPYCLSTIPARAVRCPYCTSELPKLS